MEVAQVEGILQNQEEDPFHQVEGEVGVHQIVAEDGNQEAWEVMALVPSYQVVEDLEEGVEAEMEEAVVVMEVYLPCWGETLEEDRVGVLGEEVHLEGVVCH